MGGYLFRVGYLINTSTSYAASQVMGIAMSTSYAEKQYGNLGEVDSPKTGRMVGHATPIEKIRKLVSVDILSIKVFPVVGDDIY